MIMEVFIGLEMNNVQDYYTTLEQWFYKGVSLQNGDALHLFMSEQLDLIFTKMIYVTAEISMKKFQN